MILLKKECQELEEKIKLLEKQLAEFPNYDEISVYDIPFYQFRKRKQFLEKENNYYELYRKLNLLKKQYKEISKDLEPLEFQKLVREGKIILTENDKTVLYNLSDFNSFDDLCLVHKCNFMPFNNEVKSALCSCGESLRSFNIDGVSYSYIHQEQRNTVHFAVNGEVGSHDMGNWDDRRYAIIVPFKECTNSILSACSCDTFFRDKMLLSDKCYILCPKEDEDKVRKNNNLVNVIPYEGRNVSGFANAVVSFLGYKHENVGNHGWLNYDDQYKYEKLMRASNIRMSEHMNTEYYSYDKIMNCYHHILEIYARLLGDDVIIDEITYQRMLNEEYGNVYYDLRFFIFEMLEECGNYFDDFESGRDKTINFLLAFMRALLAINTKIKFEFNFETLKLKYFSYYYVIDEALVYDILNTLFISVMKSNNKKYNSGNALEDRITIGL